MAAFTTRGRSSRMLNRSRYNQDPVGGSTNRLKNCDPLGELQLTNQSTSVSVRLSGICVFSFCLGKLEAVRPMPWDHCFMSLRPVVDAGAGSGRVLDWVSWPFVIQAMCCASGSTHLQYQRGEKQIRALRSWELQYKYVKTRKDCVSCCNHKSRRCR